MVAQGSFNQAKNVETRVLDRPQIVSGISWRAGRSRICWMADGDASERLPVVGKIKDTPDHIWAEHR